MSLSTTANKVILSGNGVTTSWPFTFPIPDATYLSVIYTDTAGVETTLSTSLYSVTGIGTTTGGSVTYPLTGSPIATGTKLTLLRTVPNTQPTILSNQGGYYPEVVEAVFDRLTMEVQQLTEKVARALVAPASDSSVGALPSATQRASTFLGFDSSSNPIAVALATTILTVSNFIQNSLLPAASAAAARTALGALGAGDALTLACGRLTLSTGVPVLTSNVGSSATVYYTPYNGNLVPIYNGTAFVLTAFTELSNILANSATGKAGPAAGAAGKNYDLFVWNDAGTVRLTRGGAWFSDTARSTATENDLQRIGGILVNLNAITNGPLAGVGTYVGTVRTDAGGATVSWHAGAVGANGTAATLHVWNMYNRVDCRGLIGDSTDSWTYSSATIRAANASATIRVSFVIGQKEDFLVAAYNQRVNCSGTVRIGIGLDATNAFTGRIGDFANNTAAITNNPYGQTEQQLLGFHFMSACEVGDGTNTATFVGDNGTTSQMSGLQYQGRF